MNRISFAFAVNSPEKRSEGSRGLGNRGGSSGCGVLRVLIFRERAHLRVGALVFTVSAWFQRLVLKP
jgi:hypothetical protein